VLLAVILATLAQRLRGPDWYAPSTGVLLVMLLGAAAVSHLGFRLALSRDRLNKLARQPVDLDRFGDGDVRLIGPPVAVAMKFRRPIERSAAASVPERDRSLVNVANSVTRWSVIRIYVMMIALAILSWFVDPISVGASSGLVIALVALLMLTCLPRIRSWVAMASG
jgi:hypothetical protein